MKVSEKNSFNKKTAAITLPLLKMFNWIDKTMNESDEVWRWVNKKIWNEPNHTKIAFNRKKTTALTLLLPTVLDLIIKTTNDSDEAWRLLHQKYGMSRIIQKFHSTKKQLLLPRCYRQCSIESMKQWMRVMKYEGECIGNMKWV